MTLSWQQPVAGSYTTDPRSISTQLLSFFSFTCYLYLALLS